MKFNIKVIPGAKVSQIQKSFNDESFKIWIKEKPVDGKANLALIRLLAEYFKVSKNKIKISQGLKSRNKIVEIFE